MNNNITTFIKLKWQKIIAVFSVFVILIHFLLKLFVSQDQIFYGIAANDLPLISLIIIGGIPLLIQILLKILKGDLGADLLAFIALVTAIYLDEFLASAILILMLSSGQALEVYAARRASFVLEALAKRMPAISHRKIGDETSDIELSEIRIGDLIEIYPHETCPVDGEVVSGNGAMDESYLTGEPYQISKAPGSFVLSGAINGESLLLIRANKLAKDSRYSTIVKVMEEAENNRPQMRRLADQIGAIFAPLALIFAAATFYFTQSMTNFLSVLVVATPCPLLIAIPISIISAISIAAKHGIIIKDPAVLEKLSICSTAIFDKTGTLTHGKPQLIEIVALNGFDEKEILQMAASLERYSRHPLALAIINAAKKDNLELIDALDISEKPGQGLTGNVFDHKVVITSRKKLGEQAKDLPPFEHGLECLVTVDDNIAALFHFRDEVRSEGHSFINHLAPNHNFKKVMLVSGDRSSEVEYLASILGIKETYSGQSPEQKLEIVRNENAKAPTLFMGDGINDAPALTAATVGIAFGQNSGVTSEAAGAVIMDNSLIKVDQLIHIGESMRVIALQSAIGGMLLSLVGMGFAAAGMINPVTGALLQEAIDVAAILNALRLIWKPSIVSDVR